jgi:hypothetical protein
MKKFVMNHIVELIGSIFSIVGIGVIIAGIFVVMKSNAFMEDAVKADGVIDLITVERRGDEYDYDVFVLSDALSPEPTTI